MGHKTDGRKWSSPNVRPKRNRTCVLLRRGEFELLMEQRKLTPEAIADRGGPHEKTVRKALLGVPVFRGTLIDLLHAVGIERTSEWIGHPEEADRAVLQTLAGVRGNLMEWCVGNPLTPVFTTSNGLQYRVFRLTHRFDGERIGRGKRYEFPHIPEESVAALKDLVLRHPKTCDRVGNHPQLARCYGTFPEPAAPAWWVIDEWVEGETLEARLLRNAPLGETLPHVAADILLGLHALHRAGIIRRELSPRSILLGEHERTVLTDFELAKLLDGSPSVSRSWPDDPYRAPEVGGGEVDETADLYSFGRILIHAAIGTLPPRGAETKCLPQMALPAGVREAALRSVLPRRSKRPRSVAEILPVIQAWE